MDGTIKLNCHFSGRTIEIKNVLFPNRVLTAKLKSIELVPTQFSPQEHFSFRRVLTKFAAALLETHPTP